MLESDLHLLYLLTPHFKNVMEPNWTMFIRRFSKLTQAEQEVACQYGIDVEYISRSSVYRPSLPDCLKEHLSPKEEESDLWKNLRKVLKEPMHYPKYGHGT